MDSYQLSVFYTIVILILAIYVTTISVKSLVNPEDLDYYLRTSHKAKYIVEKYGIEKSKELSKKYFIPLRPKDIKYDKYTVTKNSIY